MTTRVLPSFGDLLREYRRRADLTQEELAERANLSTQAVSALERGINQRPRKDTMKLLAEALHLTEAEQIVFAAAARRVRAFTRRAAAPVDPRPEPRVSAQIPGVVERHVTVGQIPRPPLTAGARADGARRAEPAGGRPRLNRRTGFVILLLGVLVMGGWWLAAQAASGRRDTTLYLATELQLSGLETAGDGRLYTDAGKVFTGTFRVRNTGSEPTSFLGLGVGVRRPSNCADPWNAPALDFPPHEGHFTLAPARRWSIPGVGPYRSRGSTLPSRWSMRSATIGRDSRRRCGSGSVCASRAAGACRRGTA